MARQSDPRCSQVSRTHRRKLQQKLENSIELGSHFCAESDGRGCFSMALAAKMHPHQSSSLPLPAPSTATARSFSVSSVSCRQARPIADASLKRTSAAISALGFDDLRFHFHRIDGLPGESSLSQDQDCVVRMLPPSRIRTYFVHCNACCKRSVSWDVARRWNPESALLCNEYPACPHVRLLHDAS